LLSLALIVAICGYLFLGLEPGSWQYALGRRIPIILSLAFAAGLVASSTILFQTITGNRLLTPSILGLDALYVLVQTMIVYTFTELGVQTPNATVNFLLSVALLLTLAFGLYKALFSQKHDMYLVLLVGTILGVLFRGLSGFMQLLLDPNEFALLQSKLFASFNNIQAHLLIAACIVVLLSLPFIYDYLRTLDVLSLGKAQATNLGVAYEASTKRIFLLVALFTAVSTALVGPITFLGLIVANLSYELTQTYKHHYIVLCGILLGTLFLVGGQCIVERIFNFNMPLSVLINFIGGIYFMYLLLRERAR